MLHSLPLRPLARSSTPIHRRFPSVPTTLLSLLYTRASGPRLQPYRSFVQKAALNFQPRVEKPTGHLFLDAGFSTISSVHNVLAETIGRLVKDAFVKATEHDANRVFDLNVNPGVVSSSSFTTKVPVVLVDQTISSGDEIPVPKPIFIAEFDYHETGRRLEKSIKEWLRVERDVHLAFLINFNENPRFSSKQAFANLPKYVLADPYKYFKVDVLGRPNNGAVQVYGVNFVGKLTAYLEVWKSNPNGEPVRRGERIVSTNHP